MIILPNCIFYHYVLILIYYVYLTINTLLQETDIFSYICQQIIRRIAM